MGLKIVLDTKEASRNADEFAKAIARVAQATGLAGKSADELMAKTASMSRRFGRIGGSAEKAAASVSRMGVGMDKASRGADKFSKSAGRASATSGKLARQIKTLAASFLGFRAVTASVSTLAKLEQGFVTLGTVTGKTGAELESLKRTAVEVAQATKFTPEETTQALLELSRAGQSAAEASKSLISVTELAAAGVVTLGSAAGLTAATMAQFKDQNIDARDAAATLVAIADRTKSTVSTLGSAMSQAGQAAASFGISLDQTVASVGLLQTAGVQASRTGRALKTILGTLATVGRTQKGKNALDELGLSAKDVIAQEGDLIGMLKRLDGALNTVTDKNRRTEILTTLVGKDFFSILETLTGGVEDIEGLIASASNKYDELSSKAQEQNATLQGSLLNVASAYQEVLLAAGDGGATGGLKSFFNSAADGIRILGGVDGALSKASSSAKIMASVMKGLVVTGGLKLMAASVGSVVAGLTQMTASLRGVAVANKAVAASSPWGLITLAIVAATAASDAFEESSRRQYEAQKKRRIQLKDITALGPIIRDAYNQETREGSAKGRLERAVDITDAETAIDAFSAKVKALRDDGQDVPLVLFAALKDSMDDASIIAVQNAERLEAVYKRIDEADRSTSRGRARTKRLIQEGQDLRKELIAGGGRVGAGQSVTVTEEQALQFIKDARASLASKAKAQALSETDLSEAGIGKSIREQKIAIDIDVSRAEFTMKQFVSALSEEVRNSVTGGEVDGAIEHLRGQIASIAVDVERARGKGVDQGLAEALREESLEATRQLVIIERQRAERKKAKDDATAAAKAARAQSAAGLKAEKEITKELEKQRDARVKLNEFRRGEFVSKVTSSLSEDLQDQLNAARSKFNEAREAGASIFESARYGAQAASGVAAQQSAERDSDRRKEEFRIATEEFESNRQALESVGATFGNSLGQALLSLADGATTAKEAFGSMAKSIIAQLLQMQLTKGFSSLFGSFAGGAPQEGANTTGGLGSILASLFGGSATANQRGGVIPAQQGRIIASPTTISRGGRSYSVSEGGGSTPEAVFPLTKDSRGRLAVSGSGGGGNSYSFSFPGIRNSQDAKAAKRTIGQSVAAVISASENKKNRMGMRPKSK